MNLCCVKHKNVIIIDFASNVNLRCVKHNNVSFNGDMDVRKSEIALFYSIANSAASEPQLFEHFESFCWNHLNAVENSIWKEE